MSELYYVISNAVFTFLTALQLAMLLRAVMSWFIADDTDNPIVVFVFFITELIVAPVRNLFDRMGWFEDFPLDMSFFATYILLSAVGGLLTIFG